MLAESSSPIQRRMTGLDFGRLNGSAVAAMARIRATQQRAKTPWQTSRQCGKKAAPAVDPEPLRRRLGRPLHWCNPELLRGPIRLLRMVPRHWNLQPIETAPRDHSRVRLEAQLSSDRPENAFNGPVYGVWNGEDWELSPFVEGTSIDFVEGWWPDEDRSPVVTLMRGESPGTVGVYYEWPNGDSRVSFVEPDVARGAFATLGKTIDEDELARLTVPGLQVVNNDSPLQPDPQESEFAIGEEPANGDRRPK
jgi:hypothetical protein